ncbi:MAG: tRNA 2-thiouridine(34) synthase MnmA [Alistipes sp.]|jgi:tRNA-specific 2-thiouridylase|nr:tRNA 2-thiouridine(34) synthase MnmA [Alistipes sp.]
MARVVVGLSGGVDSSVAAWLLKQQGHEVTGLFMRNWHDTTGTLSGDCPWEDDQLFAELVARRLGIPFRWIDLSEEYRTRVVDYMFAEYARGRTPNPDVLCNREIKFDVFLREALKLGADYVATGHYCRVELAENGMHRLLAGLDAGKDQSYFLCQLSQQQLSRAMFPIGGLQKSQVRRIAEEQKLATAKRKDSQGICFVGKVDLPTFLQQKLAARRGDIIEITADFVGALDGVTPADGIKVGEHSGAHFYTIGQRKGLGVGGTAEPLFVVATDVERNIVYVGRGDSHPGLWRNELYIKSDEIHWVRPDRALKPGESARFSMRIRYRQPLQGGVLSLPEPGEFSAGSAEFSATAGSFSGTDRSCSESSIAAGSVEPSSEPAEFSATDGRPGGFARIVFDAPQRGVTPGQFAAFYDGDELVGSGVILK